MRQKFQQFMTGRYGIDEFGRLLSFVVIILCLISIFIPKPFWEILTVLAILYCYFRIFSRNFDKRYKENIRYLEIKNKLVGHFHKNAAPTQQKIQYRIYSCPNCKQKIRVPKGKGAVMITCPKCHTEFKKRT